ncbi:MAG: GTP-binding protein, partial [Prevotella sp.]|nr:GTP-binding protein [Prevotella sp.]
MPTMGLEYVYDGQSVIDSIVTVVDALRMKDEFAGGDLLLRPDIGEEDIENLVIQQIEFCNIVLLNKASEVSPKELERTKKIIRALQPKAEIIETNYCDVDFSKILNTGLFDFDSVATSAAWISAIEERPDEHDDDHEEEHHHHHHDDDDHDHHHHDEEDHHHHEGGCHHHHHHHDEGEAEEYGIGTFVYYRRQAFNLSRFDEFVARRWPKGVIRTKGICWFHDEPEMCYVFEQAGKQVSIRNAGQWYATMPENELQLFKEQNPGLQRDWDEQYGDRMQKLVFIGQHLDKKAIAEELDRCLEA